jgi:uncharacterized protein (DUF4415 family)
MNTNDILKKPSKTDWEGLAAMSDDEIDYSDIPPLPDSFFERAKVWRPQPKVTVSVEMDADILEWFKAEMKIGKRKCKQRCAFTSKQTKPTGKPNN